MVDVIAWPPVPAVGIDATVDQPVSRSQSVLTGRRYVSAALRSRRVVQMSVPGIGRTLSSAGYVEMLKRQLLGGVNLVRIDLMPAVWRLAVDDLEYLRGERELSWMSDIYGLRWKSGAAALDWVVGVPITGVAGMLGDWPMLTCSGLPANRDVAFPSEVVRVTDSEDAVHTARVLRLTRSDADGVAVVVLDAALPSGDVLIGYRESVVFEVLDVNGIRALQPVQGDWSYTFNLREVFEDETNGFTEVNPWR